MTTTLDLNRRIDLLRERRQELQLLPPGEVVAEQRQMVRQGALWGGAVVAAVAAVGLVVTLRHQFVSASLDRVTLVERRMESLQNDLSARTAALAEQRASNTTLARALATTPSGAALMRDLQMRAPEGLQLTSVALSGSTLTLKGLASDPLGFERINVLELQLGQSPLLSEAKLLKASRGGGEQRGRSAAPAGMVAFELQVKLRDLAASTSLETTLKQLQADGLEKRLQLLRKEGLLR